MKEFNEKVLPAFRSEYSCKVLEDETIITLGLDDYVPLADSIKYKENRTRTMTYMRTLSTLSTEFQKQSAAAGRTTNTVDMFDERNLYILENVVDKLSIVDGTTKHGQKIIFGRSIKSAAQNLYPMFRMKGDFEAAEIIKNFIDCFNQRWKTKYRSSEQISKLNIGRYLRAPGNLPDESEIQRVNAYIAKEIKSISIKQTFDDSDYCRLRKLVLSKLILFNGKRPNDAAGMTLIQLKDAFSGKWLHLRKSSDCFVAYVEAKNSSGDVDILLPKELAPQLKILCDATVRQRANIDPNCNFLFASTRSSDHISGYNDLRTVLLAVGACNAKSTSIKPRF